MGFFSDLFGTTEQHEDGSKTERYGDDVSVTRDPDGSTREVTKTHYTISDTLMIGDKYKETTDADGNVINIQPMK